MPRRILNPAFGTASIRHSRGMTIVTRGLRPYSDSGRCQPPIVFFAFSDVSRDEGDDHPEGRFSDPLHRVELIGTASCYPRPGLSSDSLAFDMAMVDCQMAIRGPGTLTNNKTIELYSMRISMLYLLLRSRNLAEGIYRSVFVDDMPLEGVKSKEMYNEYKESSYSVRRTEMNKWMT